MDGLQREGAGAWERAGVTGKETGAQQGNGRRSQHRHRGEERGAMGNNTGRRDAEILGGTLAKLGGVR